MSSERLPRHATRQDYALTPPPAPKPPATKQRPAMSRRENVAEWIRLVSRCILWVSADVAGIAVVIITWRWAT